MFLASRLALRPFFSSFPTKPPPSFIPQFHPLGAPPHFPEGLKSGLDVERWGELATESQVVEVHRHRCPGFSAVPVDLDLPSAKIHPQLLQVGAGGEGLSRDLEN